MLSNQYPMRLQFFADPNGSEADPNGAGEANPAGSDAQTDTSQSSSASQSNSGVAKYTQSQMDNAMANKDHEVTEKLRASLKADFKAASQSMVSSAISYGAKRATMTADQKSSADAKASQATAKSMAAQLKSYKARDVHNKAVSTAVDVLTSAGVADPNSVAQFVADSDSAAQASKTSALIGWYKHTTDGVRKDALTPRHNPTGASDPVTHAPSTTKDPAEMTASQYLKYQLDHRK